jgi:hypothetical protein
MKKVAIMQPYFFPYIGYFSLLKNTDEFIFLDTVQFIRHGWIERNRILKQGEGWLYVKVPLKSHSQNELIKDLKVDNSQNWQQKILSQIEPYKKIAPHYQPVRSLVEELLANNYDDIVSLNKAAVDAVCGYLGLGKTTQVFSKMSLTIDEPHTADEWALNICKSLRGVDEYWNPPGGEEFFDKAKYEAAGIELHFLKPELAEYDQKRQAFETGLSIIDVMMFNSKEETNKMLDNYELT